MCDVKNCDNDYAVILESGSWVCVDHAGIPNKLICKHCKVEVVSRVDLNAVLGKEHASYCPRKRRTHRELSSPRSSS